MNDRHLSNGLCIVSIKKKTNDLVVLALTDFNKTGKFLFDLVEKKIVGSEVDLKLNSEDFITIQNRINGIVKVKEVVPVVPTEVAEIK